MSAALNDARSGSLKMTPAASIFFCNAALLSTMSWALRQHGLLKVARQDLLRAVWQLVPGRLVAQCSHQPSH